MPGGGAGGRDEVEVFPESDIDSFPNPGGESDESSRTSLLTFGLITFRGSWRPFSGGRLIEVGFVLFALEFPPPLSTPTTPPPVLMASIEEALR